MQKNDNKRKYLQQENEKYSKDCFWNTRCKFASEISVISSNTKYHGAQCIKDENGPLNAARGRLLSTKEA